MIETLRTDKYTYAQNTHTHNLKTNTILAQGLNIIYLCSFLCAFLLIQRIEPLASLLVFRNRRANGYLPLFSIVNQRVGQGVPVLVCVR